MPGVEILAHRGWWKRPAERNTLPALERAFAAGLGVETDVRDCSGELVISHDPPIHGTLLFRKLLEAYVHANQPGYLALNIKADGLQSMVQSMLREFAVENYFVFDMSVPDTLQWLTAGVRTLTRQSEFERVPVLYDRTAGVWLDGFESDWFTPELIENHLQAGKTVAVISPEIHGRDPQGVWKMLHAIASKRPSDAATLFICTDRVADARRYFHGQN